MEDAVLLVPIRTPGVLLFFFQKIFSYNPGVLLFFSRKKTVEFARFSLLRALFRLVPAY